MKKYQKIFILLFLFFTFSTVTVKTAKAITIDETNNTKAQITVVLSKLIELHKQLIVELQKQLQELIKNEATQEPKSISMVAPNGGEKWEVGKTYDIKWNMAGYSSDSKVQIKLLDERYEENSNAGQMLIAETVNSGAYSWKIPYSLNDRELFGSLYKIVVYIGEGSDKKSDTSDNYIIISKVMFPYLNVISPNGGESWEVGKTYTIKWDSLGVENYKAEILLKQEYTTKLTIAQDIPNNSYFNWKVPQGLSPTNNYRITISIYDKGSLIAQDASDNNFTIAEK